MRIMCTEVSLVQFQIAVLFPGFKLNGFRDKYREPDIVFVYSFDMYRCAYFLNVDLRFPLLLPLLLYHIQKWTVLYLDYFYPQPRPLC